MEREVDKEVLAAVNIGRRKSDFKVNFYNDILRDEMILQLSYILFQISSHPTTHRGSAKMSYNKYSFF